MTQQTFVSYAQNGEDVVLHRALQHVESGTYVDVGANDPDVDSLTRAFYQRGWRGLSIDPVERYVELHRQRRPDDAVVCAAITSEDVDEVTLHAIDGTGLSTLDAAISAMHAERGWEPHEMRVPAMSLDATLTAAGLDGRDIHFINVDTEGSERRVLESVDLKRWRPWIVVVEATAPNSTRQTHEEWEHLLLDADYEFRLFDGLSRFYVSDERAGELGPALSYPACVLDAFTTDRQQRLELEHAEAQAEAQRLSAEAERLRAEHEQLAVEVRALQDSRNQLTHDLVRWRAVAVGRFADAVASDTAQPELEQLRREVEAMRRTLSWRVTAPLREARRLQKRSMERT